MLLTEAFSARVLSILYSTCMLTKDVSWQAQLDIFVWHDGTAKLDLFAALFQALPALLVDTLHFFSNQTCWLGRLCVCLCISASCMHICVVYSFCMMISTFVLMLLHP